ncbi:sporulation protein YunB [Clostridium cavendishii DSM 21758]|uniref:Sporulation protein YunB n=1 Tax=Clostridium cavendishii DSM 21758 TaxID=1121302 RepID=A0A1M6AG98_9CLOT|nr:sporulation protein YunB [Clostridium cavendishii]SHI35253.1 sporulation protein YunB [Clostridium cavendishii DSM 21758]
MYYSNKKLRNTNKKRKKLIYFTSFVIVLLTLFVWVTYYFDKIITPTVMLVVSTEMRAKAVEIMNKNVLDVYSKNFNYDDLIKIERDKDGNVIMMRADTLKMNSIANEVAIRSQKEITEVGSIGVDMPLGYITKNNLFSHMGPKVKVKMEPVGIVETSYDSSFESAGINQTRHKIYLNFICKINIVMPFAHGDVDIKNITPVAETVIVGRVPNNPFNLDNINKTSNNENKSSSFNNENKKN